MNRYETSPLLSAKKCEMRIENNSGHVGNANAVAAAVHARGINIEKAIDEQTASAKAEARQDRNNPQLRKAS